MAEDIQFISDSFSIEQEGMIGSKTELVNGLAKVKSRIKKDITEDFVLAKLGEKDKTFIIEMVSNAFFTKKVLEEFKKETKFGWDKKEKTWIKMGLPEKDKERIQMVAEATFDSYMNKIYMIAILNRNVPKNNLVRLIAGLEEEEKEDKDEVSGFKNKLMEKIRNDEQKTAV